jgi:hypothetical protein
VPGLALTPVHLHGAIVVRRQAECEGDASSPVLGERKECPRNTPARRHDADQDPRRLADMFKKLRTKADGQGESAVSAISEIAETREWFAGYGKLLECIQARAVVGMARAVEPPPV